MQCAYTVVCCHLWPVRLIFIFPHCLINGTIFGGKKLLNIKCVFWFSLQLLSETFLVMRRIQRDHHHHHHHHVHEGLGVFPVPWSSKWNWSLHLFLGRPMFLRPFGLYRNACFRILFVSILCTCCSHFSWYCFISFTIFCAPVFPLMHWLFSLIQRVIVINVYWSSCKVPVILARC